jgi:hypothetical protein
MAVKKVVDANYEAVQLTFGTPFSDGPGLGAQREWQRGESGSLALCHGCAVGLPANGHTQVLLAVSTMM